MDSCTNTITNNNGDSTTTMDHVHMDAPTRHFLQSYLSQQNTPPPPSSSSSSSFRPPSHHQFQHQRPQRFSRFQDQRNQRMPPRFHDERPQRPPRFEAQRRRRPLKAQAEVPPPQPKAEAQNVSLQEVKAEAEALSSHNSATKVQHSQSSIETVAAITTGPKSQLYKNRLQEFAQKLKIPLPTYKTVNEGTQRVPMFRSSVWLSGNCYTNQVTFSNRKTSEQGAAKLALDSLSAMIKGESPPAVIEGVAPPAVVEGVAPPAVVEDEAPPAVIKVEAPPAVVEDEAPPVVIKHDANPFGFQATWLSKEIVNAYAVKLNVALPTYSTVEAPGAKKSFVSTMVFNGIKYTGDASRNKKGAEQRAACRAILSILSDPGSESLSKIVKLKTGFSVEVHKKFDSTNQSATVENTGHASHSLDLNTRVAGLEQPIAEAPTSKKRRKNNKKANKKARLETPLPVATATPVDAAAMLPVDVAAALPVDVAAACPADVATACPVDVAAVCPVDVAAASPVDVAAASLVDVAAACPVDVAAASPVDGSAASPVDGAAASPMDEMPPSSTEQ